MNCVLIDDELFVSIIIMGERVKLEKARERVLELWRVERKTWKTSDYTTFFQIIRSFYDKLERNNADVLSFSYLGDKWQIVNKWIMEYEKRYNS